MEGGIRVGGEEGEKDKRWRRGEGVVGGEGG